MGRGREGAIKNRNETPLPRCWLRFYALVRPGQSNAARMHTHGPPPVLLVGARGFGGHASECLRAPMPWSPQPRAPQHAMACARVACKRLVLGRPCLRSLVSWAPVLACGRLSNQGCALGGGTGAKWCWGGIELAPACAWCMCCHPRRPWCVLRAWRLLSRLGKFFVTAQTYLMSDGWTGANSLRTTIGGRRVDPPAVVGDMGIFEPGPPPSKPRALRWNGHRNEGLRAFESN